MRSLTVSTLFASLAIAGVCAAGAANAATVTSNFNATATAVASCQINSASNIAFGNYDPTAVADVDQTSTISLKCSKGTAYAVTLNQGANPAVGSTAALPLRQMASGLERLRYDIYSNAGRTTVWGSTGPSGVAGSNANFSLTTYDRLTAGQNVTQGLSFTDTVGLTVTF